ncbi:MAG: hypothetical protein RL015_3600 [Verrucomicrobiota bacterium]|jgi:hypothetical protein
MTCFLFTSQRPVGLGLAAWWVCGVIASAHPTDVSYLRVKVERQAVELRFTFNLAMLARFAVLDRDGNEALGDAEWTAAEPELRRYLQQKVLMKINDQPAMLGSEMILEPLWPGAKQGIDVATRDFPMRHVDMIFRQKVPPPLASLELDFSIWPETGPLSTVEATYEQDDHLMQVPFSAAEPDYLYDTGYAVESVFTEAPRNDQTWRLAGSLIGLVLLLLAGGLWLKKQR